MTEEQSAGSVHAAQGNDSDDTDATLVTLAADDPRVTELFGDAHETVVRFAALLADQGVLRGLIGPREVPRLWERHLVNSAAVVQFLPGSGTVIDVGTGAGLPGIVLAAMRPDLHVVLLDPMERRVTWLTEVVEQLGLPSVEVVRGRAEDMHGVLVADAVTARAVAPMDRLAGWTLPLLRAGGVLLAMKGRTALQELEDAAPTIRSLGGGPGEVLESTTIDGLAAATIIRVVRELVVPRLVTKPKPSKKKQGRDQRGSGKRTSGTESSVTQGRGDRVTRQSAAGGGNQGTDTSGRPARRREG